jgi:hypothetical protein
MWNRAWTANAIMRRRNREKTWTAVVHGNSRSLLVHRNLASSQSHLTRNTHTGRSVLFHTKTRQQHRPIHSNFPHGLPRFSSTFRPRLPTHASQQTKWTRKWIPRPPRSQTICRGRSNLPNSSQQRHPTTKVANANTPARPPQHQDGHLLPY